MRPEFTVFEILASPRKEIRAGEKRDPKKAEGDIIIRAMTNSTPKLNTKVERQGSPNGGKRSNYHQYQQQYQRTNVVKSVTYFASPASKPIKCVTGVQSKNARLSQSPTYSSGKSTRNSPQQQQLQRNVDSPTGGFYAGAKFSEPPLATSLPKPPSHWMGIMGGACGGPRSVGDIPQHLKMILKVQA